MKRDDLNRREFHKLAAAAFGGVMAGSLVGCKKKTGGGKTGGEGGGGKTGGGGEGGKTGGGAGSGTQSKKTGGGEGGMKVAHHACRGLNECKGQGAGGKNQCAGQGNCATVKHTCAGQNDCKNQGGCGANPGANACKGMGGCAVPIKKPATWEKARAAFEARMKKAGKKFGPAPKA